MPKSRFPLSHLFWFCFFYTACLLPACSDVWCPAHLRVRSLLECGAGQWGQGRHDWKLHCLFGLKVNIKHREQQANFLFCASDAFLESCAATGMVDLCKNAMAVA